MNLTQDAPFRCPTCRAAQDLTDTCRRCKSDLRLVGETFRLYQGERAHAIEALRGGDVSKALRHALECERLLPDVEARKLVAVCALLTGEWNLAVSAARCAERTATM